MRRRSLMIVTTLLAGGSASADCNVALLYDNGYPNECNGLAAQIGGPFTSGFPQAADDFGDLGGATVEGAIWHTLDAPGGIDWTGDVEVQFYREDAANPCLPEVDPYCDFIVGPGGIGTVTATIVQTPGPFGLDRVRYDARCFACVPESGNDFVSLRPICGPAGGRSLWETTRCTSIGDTLDGCEAAFRGAALGVPDWTPGFDVFGEGYDLGFLLTRCVSAPEPCPCDLDGDGALNVLDLLELLIDCWQAPCGDCTGDGTGNVLDLLAILTDPHFGGPCAEGDGTNNICGDAYLVTTDEFDFDTTGATSDGPAFTCGAGGADLWYDIVAPCTADFSVVVCASPLDAVIEVYEWNGPDCDDLGALLGCSDDTSGFGCCCSVESRVTFSTLEGERYRFRVGGNDGATGVGTLDVYCGSCFCAFDCASAEALALDETVFGSTDGVSNSGEIPCDASPSEGVRWYTVVGTGNTMTADTCSALTGDVNIYVMCGESCNELLCVGSYIQDNDILCFEAPGTARADWCSVAGQQYWVAVQGNDGPAEFELTVTDDGTPCGGQEACVVPGPDDDDLDGDGAAR